MGAMMVARPLRGGGKKGSVLLASDGYGLRRLSFSCNGGIVSSGGEESWSNEIARKRELEESGRANPLPQRC